MDLKKLLLKDLSARLCYGVMIHIEETNESEELYCLNIPQEGLYTRNKEHHNISSLCPIEQAKPYLRPMSSMTEEEEMELTKITSQLTFDRRYNLLYVGRADDGGCDLSEMEKIVDYLISHHFDFRGLISLGLALEAPEGMYGI